MICLQELSISQQFWPPISLHWGRWGRWRPNAECICIINSLDKFVLSKARVWYPTWHTYKKVQFYSFFARPAPQGAPLKSRVRINEMKNPFGGVLVLTKDPSYPKFSQFWHFGQRPTLILPSPLTIMMTSLPIIFIRNCCQVFLNFQIVRTAPFCSNLLWY